MSVRGTPALARIRGLGKTLPPQRFFSLLLLAVALCFLTALVYARESCSIEDAPASVRQLLLDNYRGWRVVTIRDLLAEDQRIWRKHYGNTCPGYAVAHLANSDRLSYAFNLIRKTHEGDYQALIVIDPEGDSYKLHVLQKPTYVRGVSVISIHPPGLVTSSVDGRSVRSKFSVITFELLESGAIVYYWSGDRYRVIQVSD